MICNSRFANPELEYFVQAGFDHISTIILRKGLGKEIEERLEK